MGAFSTFSLIKQKEDSIDSIGHNTRQLGQTIEKILRVSMLKNRREDISLAVNNIVGKDGIVSIRILNHDGIIKFSSQPHELNKNISRKNDLCLGCHKQGSNIADKNIKNFDLFRIDNENNLIYSSLPIYNAPTCYHSDCHSSAEQPAKPEDKNLKAASTGNAFHDSTKTVLGFIEIEVSIKKVISSLNSTMSELILFTVLFALLASVISYFSIRYFIGKPVKNLVEGTRRVAEGNFDLEIPPGKAELKLLADSFNRMQKQLLNTQTQLIESEKLASIGKLADEIANEINNPLTGIIIYSESLIKESDPADGKNNDYEIIRQEAFKIRESVRNILSLARMDKPDFNLIDIGRVIRYSASIAERFSNFRNIKINCMLPKSLPQVSADPALIEQLFLNLLLISSESMAAGGIIDISASHPEGNELRIIYSDTGKEIPEGILKKIFNPYHSPALENFEKLAISLTVCKDIIEMHKGKLQINTSAAGNSITINLPV